MRGHGRLGAVIGALCVAVAISGCGDDGSGTEGDPAELLDHFSGGQVNLRFVDFAAMKDQLGLPGDADVAALPTGDDPADEGQRRLATTGGQLLHYLALSRRSPLREAINHRAINAAASNVTTRGRGISLIRTSQSFDEIAAGLEPAGYVRDGDLLESRSPVGLGSYQVLADAGDGVIVLGSRRPRVEDAATGSMGPDDPVGALIEQVEGVAREAIAVGPDCVEALAVGESFDPEVAEVRIQVEGEPSADGFRLPELPKPALEYGEPEVEGEVLTAAITGGRDPNVPGAQLANDLVVSALDPNRIYEC